MFYLMLEITQIFIDKENSWTERVHYLQLSSNSIIVFQYKYVKFALNHLKSSMLDCVMYNDMISNFSLIITYLHSEQT